MAKQVTLFIENDNGDMEFNNKNKIIDVNIQNTYLLEQIEVAFKNKDIKRLESIALPRISSKKNTNSLFCPFTEALVKISKLATKENISDATLSILKQSFTNRSYAVRILVIRALSRIQDTSALPLIMDAYRTNTGRSGFHDIRIAAIEAMGNFNDTRPIPLLLHALDGTVFEVPRALNSLAKIGDLSVVPILEHLVTRENYANRSQAIETIRTIKELNNIPLNSILPMNYTNYT